MGEGRIHQAVSADGTEIAGRVHGQGPPLVLVHGILEDGDLLWGPMLPFLTERFTCYAMSTRCRGLSGDHPDQSPDRLVEDVAAFAESIDEPVSLFGESGGGMEALGAAARIPEVSAVAVYEPVVFEVLPDEVSARLDETLPRVAAAAGEGRLSDAARAFASMLVDDEELAAVSASGYFEEAGRYVPVLLREIEQASEGEGPGPTDPSVLARITAPVLVLHGVRSTLRPWFEAGARHIAEHVADARVRELPGMGHWGPVLEPEAIADEVVRFLAAAPDRV